MADGDRATGTASRWNDPWLWAIALLAVAVRLAAITRPPDIDELFTVWMTGKTFPEMLAVLRLDSGPPLYYLLMKPFQHLPDPILAFRVVSLVSGVALIFAASGSTTQRPHRLLIAALIALHPLNVFFSTLGRAYGLMALLVLVSALALVKWTETADRRLLAAGGLILVIAAYTHYYAIYLFPLPVVLALTAGRARLREAVIASAVIGGLFVPGFLLLSAQPAEALAWMRIDNDLIRVAFAAGSLGRISLNAFQSFPEEWGFLGKALQYAGPAILIAALFGARGSNDAIRHLLVIVTAAGGAIAAAALGFSAYFPLRFESVLVGPAVLFYVLSIRNMKPWVFRTLASLGLIVATTTTVVTLLHQGEGWTPQRHMANLVRKHVPSDVPIITSGPVYFELRHLRSAEWQPDLTVFPRDREVHPGHLGTPEMIDHDLPRLRTNGRTFVWVGPTKSMEARVLREDLGGDVVADQYGLSSIIVRPDR